MNGFPMKRFPIKSNATARDCWGTVILAAVLALAGAAFPAQAALARVGKKPASLRSEATPHSLNSSTKSKPKTYSTPQLKPFTLKDVGGHQCSLSEYRGRPVVLFFFCGCSWCHRCAALWSQFQRSGVLAPAATSPSPSQSLSTVPASAPPLSLVVFSGDSASVREFAQQTGLDPKQTVLLPDPDMRVTTLYQVDPCPRTFVVDPQGRLRYTNNHQDDAPQKASEIVIASRALDALRSCTPAALPSAK